MYRNITVQRTIYIIVVCIKYKFTANEQYNNIILLKNRCLLFIMRTNHLNCVIKMH